MSKQTFHQARFRKNRSKWNEGHDRELNSRVKRIKPPKTSEPADLKTIATILLRRNNDLYKRGPKGDEDYTFLQSMYHESSKRELTQAESKRVLALITWLKGRS